MLVSKKQKNEAVISGGFWAGTSYSGSRASIWAYSPSDSDNSFSARAVCDHLIPEGRSESEDKKKGKVNATK